MIQGHCLTDFRNRKTQRTWSTRKHTSSVSSDFDVKALIYNAANSKIAVYNSSVFPRGLRLLCSLRKQTKKNPKYEQTQNTNPKYEQTQNTKGFRSPRLRRTVYCNLALQIKFLYRFPLSVFQRI